MNRREDKPLKRGCPNGASKWMQRCRGREAGSVGARQTHAVMQWMPVGEQQPLQGPRMDP